MRKTNPVSRAYYKAIGALCTPVVAYAAFKAMAHYMTSSGVCFAQAVFSDRGRCAPKKMKELTFSRPVKAILKLAAKAEEKTL